MDQNADAIASALGGPGVEVYETHGSRVFLHERDVYKVKKPVRFPFLDYTTCEQRRDACDEEVRVNRRTSPDVYLGVRPLRPDGHGGCRLGELNERDVDALDWVVHMRRLPHAERADQRLAAGSLGASHVQRVAAYLAAFHASHGIPGGTGSAALAAQSPAALETNVHENLASLEPHARAILGREAALRLRGHHLERFEQLRPLLERRHAEGRVVDGHGDFRLEHVYLDDAGQVTLLDAVEFDPAFRVADVCADVAFLAMDLCSRERKDLAEGFVAAYARETGDHALYALIDFYMAYWAMVRAKVDAARAEQIEGDPADAAMERCARELFLASHLDTGPTRGAALVAVSGLIATGKSRVARALGETLAAPVVSSDRVRKQLAHRAPTETLGSAPYAGAYSEDATRAVYAEIVQRAEGILLSGRPVVLDASFQQSSAREAVMALGKRQGVPYLFVECCAPSSEVRARLLRRAGRDHDSDAREPLLEQFQSQYPPWDAATQPHHVRVDTTLPRATVDQEVLRHVRELQQHRHPSQPSADPELEARHDPHDGSHGRTV